MAIEKILVIDDFKTELTLYYLFCYKILLCHSISYYPDYLK